MIKIFLATLPLSLAASISVTFFLLFFAILVAKENQLRNSLAFIIGGIFAYAVLTLVILSSFNHAAPATSPHHTDIHAVADFILAAICFVLIISSLKKKNEPEKKKKIKLPGGVFAYGVCGALMRLVSANTLPPYIGAVKDVSGAHLPVMSSAILCVLIILATMLPPIVIWLMFLFNKQKALELIAPLSKFLEKNKNRITNSILVLVVLYLTYHGFKHLGML